MHEIIKYTAACLSVLVIIVLAVFFAGGIGDSLTAGEQVQKAAQQKTKRLDKQYNTDFTFSGNQQQEIEVTDGRTEFNLRYEGSSRFTVNLMNPDGSLFRTITDKDGPYNRNLIISVPQSYPYTLDVKAVGEWSLSSR